MAHVNKYSVFILKNIRRIYLATYKNYVCEIQNFSAKYMYIQNIYVKCIQDILSLIFQHIFISMWITSSKMSQTDLSEHIFIVIFIYILIRILILTHGFG